jgi:D-sedoheptulose 7-phosphate isomerase
MNPEIITAHLSEHLAVVEKLRGQQTFIEDLARRIIAAIDAGKKLLIFGNGGSAADAQHIAAEFVVRFRRNRRALPAIALTTDTSILTAGGNDFGFDSIFARQVEGLANAGDIVIGISTSGSSANVLNGLHAARQKGCATIAFTGEKSSECSRLADITFCAPSSVTARVQECHMLVAHIICEIVEEHLLSP